MSNKLFCQGACVGLGWLCALGSGHGVEVAIYIAASFIIGAMDK